jgi:hypothetical protein
MVMVIMVVVYMPPGMASAAPVRRRVEACWVGAAKDTMFS